MQGLLPPANPVLQEVSVEQAMRWHTGNDIWATALIIPVMSKTPNEIPNEVQAVIQEFADVFQDPKTLP
uniref:Uncharacterized protein n=1 Tax=Triticum urartu TaxID=4572 RepID=A0A8R7TSM0_TRIUA